MGIVTCCSCGLCNKKQIQETTPHTQECESLLYYERQLELDSSSSTSSSMSSSQSTSCLSSTDSSNNSSSNTSIAINENETITKNSKLIEDELVRVRINGCSTWLESHIMDILENNKYRVRIHRSNEYDKYIDNKYIRIINEDSLRKNSKYAEKITHESHIPKDIIDLYLNGRKCHKHLKCLSNIILELYNSINKDSYLEQRMYNIDYMQSRFISIEILNFCFQSQYYWRVHCFWCKKFNVQMCRASCRSHVILAGATVNGYFGESLTLMAFCDECNTELDYEDYSFRCENKEHDICLKCFWNKIKQYHMFNNIMQSNDIHIDRYSKQCIIEYVVGSMRKFNDDTT
eukprot:448169_1